MTKNCLVTINTSTGEAMADIHVNSLHQLAILMPGSVISYEVQDIGDSNRGVINDVELYDLLLGVVRDIDKNEVGR